MSKGRFSRRSSIKTAIAATAVTTIRPMIHKRFPYILFIMNYYTVSLPEKQGRNTYIIIVSTTLATVPASVDSSAPISV